MYFPTPEQIARFPPPNYLDPVTRGKALIIICSIFLVLAGVFIGLRLYTRVFLREWLGLDDLFITLAFICTVALNIITVVAVDNYGWDRHYYDIPPDKIPMSTKLAFWGKLLYLVAAMFTAYSLIAFYYRLIAGIGAHWFRIALHVTLVFNICVWTASVIGEIFICRPVRYAWTVEHPRSTHCVNEAPLTMVAGSVKTFIDLLLTTLPLPLILRMEMEKRQRILVAGLFTLGYIVTGAGAARTYYMYKVFFTGGDLSWWKSPAFISASIENDLAMICLCAPPIRPLFPALLGRPFWRVRDWITSRTPSSKKLETPKKQSNSKISHMRQIKTRVTSIGVTVNTGTETMSDDAIELVIQHNEEAARTMANHTNSDISFEVGPESRDGGWKASSIGEDSIRVGFRGSNGDDYPIS